MADDDQSIAADQEAALHAQQEQQLRSARVRAQQQRLLKQSQQKLVAGAESLVSKLGPEGVAVAVILRFIREHPAISAIIITIILVAILIVVFILVTILYYAFHPCDVNKLPIPALLKLLNTLTHIQCAARQ
jgi:hypothetical protein